MKVYENIRQDKKFVICSFYTSGEYYEGVFLDKLFPSLKKFNLPYHVEEIESLGAWQLNTGLKPLFVERMLRTYPTIDVVWVDVDGEFLKYPKLFEHIPKEFDLAVSYIDMDKWYNTTRYNGKRMLNSAVVMFRAKKKTIDIVHDWRARILVDPVMTWEQEHLQITIDRYNGISVFELPLEYCYIATLPNGEKPFIKLDPVITQHQAGRRVNRRLEVV